MTDIEVSEQKAKLEVLKSGLKNLKSYIDEKLTELENAKSEEYKDSELFYIDGKEHVYREILSFIKVYGED